MHNRLIFRYHGLRDNADLQLLRGCRSFGADRNRPTAVRRVMRGRRKVDEPRRWLSWGKRVGRGVGKSAPHKD